MHYVSILFSICNKYTHDDRQRRNQENIQLLEWVVSAVRMTVCVLIDIEMVLNNTIFLIILIVF